jgi:hypothetical protein
MKGKNMSNKKGYVYILTNPSFRDDWVKIGKSEREVDVRSKELYNTAVPLPFEIYATIKTVKYEQVEKKLHKIFTDLAGLRINDKREFFKIRPEKALEYLQLEAETIDDAELNAPEADNDSNGDRERSTKPYKGKYTVNTSELFHFYRDTTDATMKAVNGNKYVVLEGSRIDPEIYSNIDTVSGLRAKYAGFIKDNITTQDIEFNSPSTAAEFVGGGAANGKVYWRTESDRKLEEFIEYVK